MAQECLSYDHHASALTYVEDYVTTRGQFQPKQLKKIIAIDVSEDESTVLNWPAKLPRNSSELIRVATPRVLQSAEKRPLRLQHLQNPPVAADGNAFTGRAAIFHFQKDFAFVGVRLAMSLSIPKLPAADMRLPLSWWL
ncbi:hypothetical protein D9756_010700 [Leucocoprinus leucothites]|uniref:Uncharacterized protein n=1 Tax=Leucocoprinus leucothites TaxID=201217 RepID=A0A8H5CV13_9AGAR|nr:hypothetical protein D9756_010700 [Leucoagaricus leucothites]